MELIGITGKSGSGKTTFSDMLSKKSDVGVIHVDDILREVKLKYFRVLMKEDKNGEKTKINSKLKEFLYTNKLLFAMFMRLRANLIKKTLSERIQKMSDENKRIILIDDTFIQYEYCYQRLSKIFILERPFVERRRALEARDKLTKEEVVAYDMAHNSGNYIIRTNRKPTIRIPNSKSKEELEEMAEDIYQKHFATMREKYRVSSIQEQKIIEKTCLQRKKERVEYMEEQ